MALSLSIPGGPVQLSGNRVQAEVETTATTGELYNLLIKTTSLDASFPEGIDAIEPNAELKALFDLRNRVTLPIVYSFTWPLTGAVSIAQPQMAKKVALDVGERFVQVVSNKNEDTVNWAELTADNEILILRGGLSKHQQAKYNEQNTNFYDEFIAAGQFLTELPNNMRISPGQPVKLWFITKEVTNQALTLKVDYSLLSGSEGTLSHAVTIDPDKMYELCVDPGSLGLDASEVASYSVYFEKLGVTISATKSYTIDHGNYEHNTFLLYANRIGGIDCVWLHGHVKRSFPTESERSQRDARITDTQQRPTLEVDWKVGKRSWEINSGYKMADEMTALTGLFESRNVWLLDGNDIIPVMMEDGDNAYLDSLSDANEMELKFTEAH
ncbi:hypothetical protein [Sunxiuqinia sp. sy24]|uniref:hypothetical protein n=1 Tax=Sunxiuqinia sp. sy24 TaxID=3461495 RepID=UPI0040460679